MSLGFILTLASIVSIPFVLFFDGAIAQSLVTALSALTLGLAAREVRTEDLDQLRPTLIKVLCGALLISLWMLIQALPLGIFGVGHPIWLSAGAALGSSLVASISVDPGTTLVALGHYTGFVALGLAVAMVALERRNAEQILFGIVAVTVLVALISLFRKDSFAAASKAAFIVPTIVAIGCIAAVASAVRAYERSETRRQGPYWQIIAGAIPGTLTSVAAFLLCFVALVRVAPSYAIVAALFGLGIFAALSLIRRLGFGVWGVGGIGLALIAIAFAVFTQSDITRSSSLLSAFVPQGGNELGDLAVRMLVDVRWAGIGAGTFPELMLLYRDVGEGTAAATAGISTNALLAIELGRPFLGLIAAGVFALGFVLLQATIKRGRDSFFPAAGAASILVLVIASFGDTGLLTLPVATLTSIMLGLSLAQTVGRSTRR